MRKKKNDDSAGVIKIQKMNAFDVGNIVFLFLFALLVLYPFYNSVLISLTPETIYVRNPFVFFPKNITLGYYRSVLHYRFLFTGFRTTILVTVIGVAFNMILTLLSAFSFSKEFPLKKFFLIMIYLTLFFEGGLIPFYLLIKNLGLMDSIFSMILPPGMNILYMVVMRKYFAAIPAELEESAKLDGASDLRILWRIILPLSIPMIVTFILFYGVDRWNEWRNGMLFIRTIQKQPLQLVLRDMLQTTGGVSMAAIVVTMAPIMGLYPFMQKYFVQGLAIGAVKG